MLNRKRIKLLIVISLVLIQSFVWTFYDTNRSWSLGILGGADGPTSIFIPKPEKKQDGKAESGEKLDQSAGKSNKHSKDQEGSGGSADSFEHDQNWEQSINKAEEEGLLILVNKEHSLEQNYKPDDLEKIKYFAPDRSSASRYMRGEAAKAFHQMVEKAKEENLEFKMTTAYRSYSFQKLLYDNYVEKEGEEAANKYSAKPGQSEHQTGLAVDVSSPSVDYQLSNEYGQTEEGKWLTKHAHEFGFIIRYPQGKEDITGYQYEPWHIRYVGQTAAKEIYEQNLTLEEYLQIIKID